MEKKKKKELISLSENGDSQAQYELALKYYNRILLPNHKKAFDLFLQAAKSGHGLSQYMAASCYELGRGVAQNPQEAHRWYSESAKNGVAQAKYSMGLYFERGLYEQKDFARAYENFHDAANGGIVDAQWKVGYYLLNGIAVKKDEQTAFSWIEFAANGGNGDAMYELARIYEEGKLVKANQNLADKWYGKGAHNGNVQAMLKYAEYWQYQIKSDDGAETWYRRAAETGNAEAQYCLANFLGIMSNKAFDKHDEEKVKSYGQMIIFWLHKAAEQNYLKAQERLVFQYLTEQDYRKAYEWIQRAAKNGSIDCKYVRLAWCYIKGQGVPKDIQKGIAILESGLTDSKVNNEEKGFFCMQLFLVYFYKEYGMRNNSKAFYWINKSVELQMNTTRQWGNADFLAYCYLKGIGTPVDIAKAKFYYQKYLTLNRYDDMNIREALRNYFGF